MTWVLIYKYKTSSKHKSIPRNKEFVKYMNLKNHSVSIVTAVHNDVDFGGLKNNVQHNDPTKWFIFKLDRKLLYSPRIF